MIEKIHLTASVFAVISFLFISSTDYEKLNIWVVGAIQLIFASSALLVASLMLWRIWA